MPCDWFDASDAAFRDTTKYPNGPIQGAIDAACYPLPTNPSDGPVVPNGGTVYIPRGTWEISQPLVIPHAFHAYYNPRQPLIIQGAGPNATIIKRTTGTFDLLTVRRGFVTVRDLALDGNAAPSGTRGIVVGNETPGSAPSPLALYDVRRVNLINLIVRGTNGNALRYLGGFTPTWTPITVTSSVVDCVFANNGSVAAIEIAPRNTTIEFLRCVVEDFFGKAVVLNGCEGITFECCRFNSRVANDSPYVLANDSSNCQLTNCWFEEPAGATSLQWFIYLDKRCHACTIANPTFVRRTGTVPFCIVVGNATAGMESKGTLIINPFCRTTAGTPTSHHFQVISPSANLTDLQLIGGVAASGDPPNYGLSEVLVYFDVATPGRTMISNNTRFRAATVNTLPTSLLRAGDVVVEGNFLKMWTGTAWKKILTEA